MKAPELESKRLIIKPLDLSFLSENYVNWLNDKDVNKYLSTDGNYSIDKLKGFLKEVQKKNILFWAILTKEKKAHIGNIKIDPIDFENGLGEYGIMMGNKKEWGKGYAYEVSNLVIDYCFKELKLRKMTLGCIEDNKIAINLYEKLNFKVEGKFVNHIYNNGELVNTIRMALFNKDFNNI